MKKKKIAIFGVKGFPAFGGAARSNECVVNILKNKYDFTIYSVSTHTNKEGFFNGYNQIVFKGYKNKRINTFMYYMKSLLHALIIGDYDLVHVNHIYSGFINPLLKLKYSIISTAHGVIPKDDKKWNKLDKLFFDFFSFLFFKFSDRITSVSLPHIKYFKKYTNKKIDYIPNGVYVNTDLLQSKFKQEEYILFAASRIIPLKGCHLMLSALNKLNYKNKVIIIGDLDQIESYKVELKKLSENLNIEYIDVIKDQSVLFEFIVKSKLFIFPSLNEGMSNMLLEVASLKTPIICSDIPENTAVFNETEVTFFKSNDTEDLANKIDFVIRNEDIRKTIALNAYEKVIKFHNWYDLAAKYSEIYDSIIKK